MGKRHNCTQTVPVQFSTNFKKLKPLCVSARHAAIVRTLAKNGYGVIPRGAFGRYILPIRSVVNGRAA